MKSRGWKCWFWIHFLLFLAHKHFANDKRTHQPSRRTFFFLSNTQIQLFCHLVCKRLAEAYANSSITFQKFEARTARMYSATQSYSRTAWRPWSKIKMDRTVEHWKYGTIEGPKERPDAGERGATPRVSSSCSTRLIPRNATRPAIRSPVLTDTLAFSLFPKSYLLPIRVLNGSASSRKNFELF